LPTSRPRARRAAALPPSPHDRGIDLAAEAIADLRASIVPRPSFQAGPGKEVTRKTRRRRGCAARRKSGIEFLIPAATLPAMSTIICPRSKTEVDREVATIRRVGKEIARTKESARAFLIRTGLLTKSGRHLAKRYR
jgi:hypothetical protein